MNLSSVSSKVFRLLVELVGYQHGLVAVFQNTYFPNDVLRKTLLSQTLAANATFPLLLRSEPY